MKSWFFLLVFMVSFSTQADETIKEKSSFDKFYENLRISYFGAYSGSSIGQWDYRAVDEKGTQDKSYGNNLFSQVAFAYNFGWKLSFVFSPRFTLNTGTTKHFSAAPTGRGMFAVEDFLTGFQGVVYSSADKKFNAWTRFAFRLPTSRASRAADITFQPEILSNPAYDFNPEWQLGGYVQLRSWVYDQAYTARRFRTYFAPYLQYAVTDKDKIAIWYEIYLENRNNLKSFNGKEVNYQAYWHNAMISYSKDITPQLNFMPFVGYILNTGYAQKTRPLDPAWLGFWLSYVIK